MSHMWLGTHDTYDAHDAHDAHACMKQEAINREMCGQLSQVLPTHSKSFELKLKATLRLICDLEIAWSSPSRLNTEVPWRRENQLQH